MKVNTHAQVTRAVGSEFVARKLKGISTAIAIISALFIGVGVWLITLSAWWWILMAVMIAWILLGIALLALAWFAVKVLRPHMTKQQHTAVNEFVDKIERVSETLQTTPFMIFFRILKDVLFPSDKPFIRQIADDSTTLHSDYISLSKLFE